MIITKPTPKSQKRQTTKDQKITEKLMMHQAIKSIKTAKGDGKERRVSTILPGGIAL
jgi:hypothetical protein